MVSKKMFTSGLAGDGNMAEVVRSKLSVATRENDVKGRARLVSD